MHTNRKLNLLKTVHKHPCAVRDLFKILIIHFKAIRSILMTSACLLWPIDSWAPALKGRGNIVGGGLQGRLAGNCPVLNPGRLVEGC